MGLSMLGNQADFLDRYKGNVAINVKYHGTPKLSKETLAVLAKLDGATRDNIVRFAEEALRDNWWATAQERSRELGLGDLWTDGRSGGWLVFKMTMSQFEELAEQVEKGCRHCGKSFEHHLDSKCPFEASMFEPEDVRGLEVWNAFHVFASEVKTSLQTIGEGLEDEILFQLENLDDDGAAGVLGTGGSETNPKAFEDAPGEEGP